MTDTSLALGSFDGLHIGHMQVLRSALGVARAVAVMFDIPPVMVRSNSCELLLSIEEKHRILRQMGFETDVLDFHSVCGLSAFEFLSMLKQKYEPKKICCGFNYRFGRGQEGTIQTLRAFCEQNGITLSVTPAVTADGESVSSSRIRALIKNGDIQKANTLLGRSFSLRGRVSHGDERGRTIGFPTVNFTYPDLCRARHGVYAAHSSIDGKSYSAVCYIGHRPTFSVEHTVCETHIIGFSGDLYDRNLTVGLDRYIRGDMVFASKEELKEQIKKDVDLVVK